MEKREHSYTVVGHIYIWSCHCENSMEVFPKSKNRTTVDPAIPLLVIYPKISKTLIQTHAGTSLDIETT